MPAQGAQIQYALSSYPPIGDIDQRPTSTSKSEAECLTIQKSKQSESQC